MWTVQLLVIVIIALDVNELIVAAPSGFHHLRSSNAPAKHRRATRSNQWGFSSVMTDDSTNGLSLNDKLIFGGVVVSNSNSRDVVAFPGEFNTINKNTNDRGDDEYNDIDLSGSFALSSVKTTLPHPTTPSVDYNLNALCTSVAQMRLLIELNANATTGTFTYPNGTQITFARCEVILIKHPD